MERLKQRTAMVTGASSGIGRAIAVAMGQLGWTVALGARRRDRLDLVAEEVEAAGGRAIARALDVASLDSVYAFLATVLDEVGTVDVLVNNAGVTVAGDVADLNADAILRSVNTNLLGSLYPTRLLVASLLEKRQPGDVVFITSDAMQQLRPAFALYGATRAAVEHLAGGLSYEVEGSGIRISTVRAGPATAEFADDWPENTWASLLERWRRGDLYHAGVLHPTDVARAVIQAVTAPDGMHLPTIEALPEPPLASNGH